MNIYNLVPKNKFDHEKVDMLLQISDEELKSIVPELLEWTADYNWPVAQALVPILKLKEHLIFPYIKDILYGEDLMWKSWIMELFIPDFSREHKELLKRDIMCIASIDVIDEDTAMLAECAKACYKKCFD